MHEYEPSHSTSAFLPIGQSGRYNEFPLLSGAHVLQAFIPAFDRFSDAQGEPHRLLVSFSSTGGQTQGRGELKGCKGQEECEGLADPLRADTREQ